MSSDDIVNKPEIYPEIVDISFKLIEHLGIFFINDKSLLDILFNRIGKQISSIIEPDKSREEIESILTNKVRIFHHYFSIFNTRGSKRITVYYPRINEGWVNYQSNNSLQVSVFSPGNMPKGFFLIGFDYKYEGKFIRAAFRSKSKNKYKMNEYEEYINPRQNQQEDLIWLM